MLRLAADVRPHVQTSHKPGRFAGLQHSDCATYRFTVVSPRIANQCSRIRYARTLRTVIPNKPTTVLKITMRSGQTCRTIRVHRVTAAEPITVTPAPAAINTSMSLVLWAKAINGTPDCHTDLLERSPANGVETPVLPSFALVREELKQ